MAGLLDGFLPWVYSTGNQVRRNVRGLLEDPRAFVGSMGQDIDEQNRQRSKDYGLLFNPGVMTSPQERKQAMTRAAQEAVNYAAPTVYHGSPHKFDKFDSSKIGTGEGAQAYAHGLYFAEAKPVAEEYRKALSGYPEVGGRRLKGGIASANSSPEQLAEILLAPAQTADDLARIRAEAKTFAGGKAAPVIEDWIASGKVNFGDKGYLYKVDLPDSAVAKMLDWDKPLSQQAPEVQKALAPMLEKVKALPDSSLAVGERAYLNKPDSLKGSDVYNMYRRYFGGENVSGADASGLLQKAGIPGIRYLDQGSRFTPQAHIEFSQHLDGSPRFSVNGPKGDQHFDTMKQAQDYIESLRTKNYVVFPGGEGLLNIMERNGQPLIR